MKVKNLTKVDQMKVKTIQGFAMILFQQMANLHTTVIEHISVSLLLKTEKFALRQEVTWRSPTESDPSWASATGCNWNSCGPCAQHNLGIVESKIQIYREQWENRWEEMEDRVWRVMLRRGKKSLLGCWCRQFGHILVQTRLWQLLVVGAGQWWDIFWLCHNVVMQSGHEHCNESPSGNMWCILSDPAVGNYKLYGLTITSLSD